MTEQREYLVALQARSTLHAWIAAPSEDDAIDRAEELYDRDDSTFTAKGGSIESVTVLDSRPAPPASQPKRFTIAFEQPVVHRIVVEAEDLDAAIDKAEQLYVNEGGFFTFEPPAGWHRVFNDWDLVEAEEVLP